MMTFTALFVMAMLDERPPPGAMYFLLVEALAWAFVAMYVVVVNMTT